MPIMSEHYEERRRYCMSALWENDSFEYFDDFESMEIEDGRRFGRVPETEKLDLQMKKLCKMRITNRKDTE